MKRKFRYRILYFDDDKRYYDKLLKKHNELYDIEYIDDIRRLPTELRRREGTPDWPDILLVDLYWPLDRSPEWENKPALKEKDIEECEKEVEDILDNKVKPAIREQNKKYLEKFTPCGLDFLQSVQKTYGIDKTPPAILYTSKGHFLLEEPNQDWLRRATELHAYWLPKGTATSEAEALGFERVINDHNKLKPRLANLIKDPKFIVEQVIVIAVTVVLTLLVEPILRGIVPK